MRSTALLIEVHDGAQVVEEKVVEHTGVVDLRRIRAAFAGEIRIPVELVTPLGQAAATLRVLLDVPAASPPVSPVSVPIQLEPGNPGDEAQTHFRLEIVLRFTPGTIRNVELSVILQGGQVHSSDLTALAEAGRLRLEASLGSFTVGFLESEIPVEPLAAALACHPDGVRTALTLCAAAPRLPGLLSGWIPIAGEMPDSDDLELPLRELLPKLIGAFVTKWFPTLLEGLIDHPALGGKLKELLNELVAAAVEDSVRLARGILPPLRPDDHNLVTQDAAPLILTVDRLNEFAGEEDLWTRVAGLGVLLGRHRPDGTAWDRWWSLNVATLHRTQQDAEGNRLALGQTNAVRVRAKGDWPGSWRIDARVDPVPYVVSEHSGVRTATIRYESQSIVAETPIAATATRTLRAPRTRRRPEAYLFPLAGIPQGAPAHVRVRLRGDPVPRRTRRRASRAAPDSPADPVTLKPPLSARAEGGAIQIPRNKLRWLGVDGKEVRFIRSRQHLRTVPVGAPRLTTKNLPGIPEGVAPLAAELPMRPAPFTLRAGVNARFFMDGDRLRGVACQTAPTWLLQCRERRPRLPRDRDHR